MVWKGDDQMKGHPWRTIIKSFFSRVVFVVLHIVWASSDSSNKMQYTQGDVFLKKKEKKEKK